METYTGQVEFLYVVKLIDEMGDPQKSVKFKQLATGHYESLVSDCPLRFVNKSEKIKSAIAAPNFPPEGNKSSQY